MGKRVIVETPGTQYGALEVIGPAAAPENAKQKAGWWLCRCRCGNEAPVWGGYLRSHRATTCGCGQRPKPDGDEDEALGPGKRVGMLEMIRKVPRPEGEYGLRYAKSSWWLCRCDCGEEVLKPHVYLRQTVWPHCGCKRGQKRQTKTETGEMRARKAANAGTKADQGKNGLWGVSINTKRCGVCGKSFDAYAGPSWAYKRSCARGRTEYYCSYGCMRRHDREHPARMTRAHI